jgi:hypothetical protein
MTALVPMLASGLILFFLSRYPLQGERLALLRSRRLAGAAPRQPAAAP